MRLFIRTLELLLQGSCSRRPILPVWHSILLPNSRDSLLAQKKEIRGDYVLKRNGALGACTRLYQNVQTSRPSHRSVGKPEDFSPTRCDLGREHAML